MKSNRSMPDAVIIPVLAYADVRTAVEWLCRSFGFVERLRIGSHRAQLSFGEGSVIVTESASSSSTLGSGQSVMVRVDDVDAHCARARQGGAKITSEPATYPYGERQYTAGDPGGHQWTFSQTVEDVDPKAWGGS